MKSKGPSAPVAPYRTGDVTQQLKVRYIKALNQAEREWTYREKIINVFMLAPTVIGISQILKEHMTLPAGLALMLITSGLPVLFRAMLVDSEKVLLKKIREKVNRISADRHDQSELVEEENRKIINGLTSYGGPVDGPYMITACTSALYWILSRTESRMNSSLIFFSGFIAIIVVYYHAEKLRDAQDAVRAELRELLPHVEPEKKSDTHGGATHTQPLPLAVPVSLDKQDADTTVQDCRTGVRFNVGPHSSELAYASGEVDRGEADVGGEKAAG